jgi:hypothetical protein
MNSLSIIVPVIIALTILWLIYKKTKNRRGSYGYYDGPVNLIHTQNSTDSSTEYPANQYDNFKHGESATGSWNNNDTSTQPSYTDSTEFLSDTDANAEADTGGDIGNDFSSDSTGAD